MITRHSFELEEPWVTRLEDLRGSRWSQHFGRSDLGDNVFSCRIQYLPGYLRQIGFPGDQASEMCGPYHAGLAFADGGWFLRRQSNTVGLVPGGLNGQWIVGFGALRYLCARFELIPPRRLRGERFDPDPERLVEAVEAMIDSDLDGLRERATLLTGSGRFRFLTHVMEQATGRPHHLPELDDRQVAELCDATSAALLERCERGV